MQKIRKFKFKKPVEYLKYDPPFIRQGLNDLDTDNPYASEGNEKKFNFLIYQKQQEKLCQEKLSNAGIFGQI